MKIKTSATNFIFRLIVWASVVSSLFTGVLAQTKLRDALDFDGDKKADYTIFRPADNSWFTLRSSDNTLDARNFGVNDTDTLTPGDYDGDGKADIAVWRQDGGWYRLNSSNNTFTAVSFGIKGDEPMARDYDGDGKTDPAIIRRTSSTMTWWIFQSSTNTAKNVQWGLNTDMAAPGDYDGDGKFDVAVYRPGATAVDQSTFYILKSSDNSVGYGSWGLGGDWVVPGDYDGDGKTDLAIVRRNSTAATGDLVWYVLKSSDGNLLANSFGNTETDSPIQNDYDGDGKTDVAVWRETDATFYVFNSGSSNLSVINWGIISDYPVASYDTH